MRQAAAPLRLYFILPTLYFLLHTALHGGDAVRCSRLPLHCLSTASLLHASYFILYTSYFITPPLVMPALRSFATVDLETQFIY
jgi:hypothetical protein